MATLDDPGLFGRQWAASYDGPGNPDPGPAAEFLAGLAAGGPALELAIGSGRVALPLAGHGVAVEGIEASPEMVELMRAKPEQIDELAEAAGLRLQARHANWQREPFGPDSRDHISVYRKA